MKLIKTILRITKSLVILFFLVCVVIFMVNNREAVVLHLTPLSFNIETRMFVVLVVVFLIGMLFGLLVLSQNLIGGTIANINNRRKIRKLQESLKNNQ